MTTIHAEALPAYRSRSVVGRLHAVLRVVWVWLCGPAAYWAHRGFVRIRSLALQAGGLGIGTWVLWTEVGRLAGGLAAMVALLLLEFLLRPEEPVR